MGQYNPRIVDIRNLEDAEREIKEIGSDPYSIDIMAPKAVLKVIKFENILLQDAIIIKQDMLSIGGEVAVPKNTFKLLESKGNILIIGNLQQLKTLIKKLNRHYQRLRNIAKDLELILKDVSK